MRTQTPQVTTGPVGTQSDGKKKLLKRFIWGLIPGPSACKADVITTTLMNPLHQAEAYNNTLLGATAQGCIHQAYTASLTV